MSHSRFTITLGLDGARHAGWNSCGLQGVMGLKSSPNDSNKFMALGNLQQQPVMLFHFFPEKKTNLCSMYGISILEKPHNERHGNKCKDT
jgi:hypothetical protein